MYPFHQRNSKEIENFEHPVKSGVVGLLSAVILGALGASGVYAQTSGPAVGASAIAVPTNQVRAPHAVLEGILQDVKEATKNDAALKRGDLKAAQIVIEQKLLPYTNTRRMAQTAMGRPWREATESQREKVSLLMGKLIAKSYARAFVEGREAKVEFTPARMNGSEGKVRAKVVNGSEAPLAVVFAVEVQESGATRVFDIEVEGISLMNAYKENFKTIISQKGVDGLIEELEKKVA